jgi:Flp pilus assembly protein TadG
MIRHQGHRQRGAVAVEFAIVLPLLALLVFGAIEMGSAWNDSQTVLSSSRTAARSLAQFGDAPQADRDALLSVEAAFANSSVSVAAVIIYESDDTVNAGGAPTACVDAAEAGVTYAGGENCNVYPSAEFAMAVSPTGATSFGCTGTDLDSNWCPTSRTRNQATATFIGVHVFGTRTSVTGVDEIPVPTSLDQFSVMRLEPFPT